MSKIAILDGDAWVYRCGGAAEHTYYLLERWSGENQDQLGVYPFDNYRDAVKRQKEIGGTLWSRKEIEPLENCLQMVKTSLENTLDVLGIKDYRLYLGGRKNFRSDLYGDYKANRDSTPKPKYYRDIRDYLVGKWNGIVCEGIEADDAVAIDAIQFGPDRAVIVAVDKDLDQIPGVHYNWTDGRSYTVSPREGLRFFYEQLLSGDTTDNIPGLPGIGPARATKALADCETPKAVARQVWQMYYERRDVLGISDDDAQRKLIDRNASLLWIKRRIDDTHPFWKHYEG